MKILHLIIDHQVIERTLRIFEDVLPMQNDVLIFSDVDTYRHLDKYSKSFRIDSRNLKYVADSYDFSDIKYVICHYLTLDMIDFVKRIPNEIHVSWEIYGFDLYNQFLEKFGMKLYAHDTPYDHLWHSTLRKHFPRLYDFGLFLKGHRKQTTLYARKAFNYITRRINSVGVACRNDLKLLELFSGLKYDFYDFCNYSLEETLGELYYADYSKGSHILVGNSASFSNNHLYILDNIKILKNKDDLNLVLVLSYGGIPEYRDKVMRAYEAIFSSNVKFITSYIPLNEYNKSFLMYNSMILSSWRQESIGTILMGFHLGIKVYMSQVSPLYSFYKDLGFSLFTIESDDILHINEPLSNDIRKKNRDLLHELYNDDIIKSYIRQHFK